MSLVISCLPDGQLFTQNSQTATSEVQMPQKFFDLIFAYPAACLLS